MRLGEINVRRMDEGRDEAQLNEWRESYFDGDLEIPHGWHGKPGRNDNVATYVAEKNGELIGSLTGLFSVVLDPFIHNPDAKPTDVIAALVKLETVLSCAAQGNGAIDLYIAIPLRTVSHYGKVLEGYGFSPTVEGCKVYRKALRPDHVPLLGDARDAKNVAADTVIK